MSNFGLTLHQPCCEISLDVFRTTPTPSTDQENRYPLLAFSIICPETDNSQTDRLTHLLTAQRMTHGLPTEHTAPIPRAWLLGTSHNRCRLQSRHLIIETPVKMFWKGCILPSQATPVGQPGPIPGPGPLSPSLPMCLPPGPSTYSPDLMLIRFTHDVGCTPTANVCSRGHGFQWPSESSATRPDFLECRAWNKCQPHSRFKWSGFG